MGITRLIKPFSGIRGLPYRSGGFTISATPEVRLPGSAWNKTRSNSIWKFRTKVVEYHQNYGNPALLASGVGIAGIQERVRELGGRMEIQSVDRGMRLVVDFPIPEPR